MTNGSDVPHVVVIGAGIIGSSIAFNLSHRNVRVTLLDADEPGQAASRISFAWINGRDKDPRHYHDLNRRSLDIWERFSRRLGGDVGLTWGGELRWAATGQGAKELVDRVRTLQSWGYPISLIGESEINEMEPRLVTGPVAAASYTQIDGHVDTSKVIRACLDRAKANGVEIRSGTKVTDLHLARAASGRTRVEALATATGEIECDVAVLATGADTTELAAKAGIEISHHYTFGATVITEPVAPQFENLAVVHTPRDAEPMLNMRQFADGSFMVHGGSHGGDQDESMGRTQEDVGKVFQAAMQYLPGLKETKIAEVRKGRRPMPGDGHPILGFSEAVPNLYFATMHSGVSLAALTGEFATIEIVDGACIDILEPYRVERFTR